MRKKTDLTPVQSDMTSRENGMELGKSNPQDDPADSLEASGDPPATGVPRLRIVPPESGRDPAEGSSELADDDLPDVALIAALSAGEVEALGALYDRHSRILFALIVRIAGTHDTAEEILQEVFLRAWQHANTYDDTRGTVRNWLHGIAHNLALNELRSRRRRPLLQERPARDDPEGADQAQSVEAGIDPAVDAWCAIRDAELAFALDQLPQVQRTVLLLYAEGYSQSEIAAKLGEPLGTVKSRIRRALCHLRQTLPTLGIDANWRGD